MVRKPRKHNIEGIPIIITQKTKWTYFNNSVSIRSKIKKIFFFFFPIKQISIEKISYTKMLLRLIIGNFYKSNELCAEANPGILSHPI